MLKVYRILSKMDVNPLLQKSELINEKIEILRQRFEELKKSALASIIKKEEERLHSENVKLEANIAELKRKLMEAEVFNGKVQVSMPELVAPVQLEGPPVLQSATPPKESEEPKKPKSDKKTKKKQPQQAKPTEGVPVDVSRLDLRVARIVKAEKHPDANTLYVEDIETGEETNRTVISGLVQFVPEEEMQNRLVILLMNLKPAKMRGILSQAMVMCASSPEKVELLTPPPGSVPGDRITFEGYPGSPDQQLNPKKKIWEQIQPDLRTDNDKVACYKGVPFTVAGKGVCTAPTMSNSDIK